MGLIQLFNFDVITDSRGELVVLENNKTIPFEVKRIYYMRGMSSETSRGYHAHKKLKQIIFPMVGSCRFLLDDGREQSSIVLSSFSKGLFVNEMIWHEMHDFSEDCVLVALANDYYDETDYIRNYQEFIKLVNL